jgi:lipoprotein-anchoring transpeptidase ErfK/SrfK
VPDDYWPRNTGVTVAATGAQTAFQISDAFEAVGDADGHTFSVKIGGDVVRTFPAALGKPGHETPNGTFHVLAKEADVVMDSSTYGVPIDAPEGYRVDVKWATRLTWDGIYVHAAPWSVDQQGNSNVSHGCINLSTTNAKWYYDNVRNGDAVTIVNA